MSRRTSPILWFRVEQGDGEQIKGTILYRILVSYKELDYDTWTCTHPSDPHECELERARFLVKKHVALRLVTWLLIKNSICWEKLLKKDEFLV